MADSQLPGEYNERHRSLVHKAEWLFGARGSLLSLWQMIADQFYPERASFTVTNNTGEEYAAHLSTSYPAIIRRDLGDSISGILRPRGQEWFKTGVNVRDERLDSAAKQFLEFATEAQRDAMYDKAAQLNRAVKPADHDYATFGQAALSAEINLDRMALLYRCHHLRDMAWCENAYGEFDLIARKWKCTAAQACQYFGDRVHEKVKELKTRNGGKDAYEMVEFLHIVVRADAYEYKTEKSKTGRAFPFVSLWVDTANKHVMEETGRLTQYYIIPRWAKHPETQYAHSPATMIALPDARLIQAMTYTLLRAGEKAVDPPLIATQEAVRSDIATYPGGVTWVDADYDEKLGEVLRPITSDYRGLPTGMAMQDKQFAMLESAFYINKLTMPPVTHEMTAEEARYRVQQYIRQALPLFEPIEQEYNAPLCEQTFDLLLSVNAFGPVQSIPESLQGAEIQFKFESPLIEARDQELVPTFMDTKNLLLEASQLDPAAAQMMNVQDALREALKGRGTPTKWLKDEATMEQLTAQAKQDQEAMKATAMVGQGAAAAEQVGRAGQAIEGMGQAA
jgi:hypothetical protein